MDVPLSWKDSQLSFPFLYWSRTQTCQSFHLSMFFPEPGCKGTSAEQLAALLSRRELNTAPPRAFPAGELHRLHGAVKNRLQRSCANADLWLLHVCFAGTKGMKSSWTQEESTPVSFPVSKQLGEWPDCPNGTTFLLPGEPAMEFVVALSCRSGLWESFTGEEVWRNSKVLGTALFQKQPEQHNSLKCLLQADLCSSRELWRYTGASNSLSTI